MESTPFCLRLQQHRFRSSRDCGMSCQEFDEDTASSSKKRERWPQATTLFERRWPRKAVLPTSRWQSTAGGVGPHAHEHTDQCRAKKPLHHKHIVCDPPPTRYPVRCRTFETERLDLNTKRPRGSGMIQARFTVSQVGPSLAAVKAKAKPSRVKFAAYIESPTPAHLPN